MIIERHGTMSWAGEDLPEPPYHGKIHIILENTEVEPDHSCLIACSTGGGREWQCDFVDDAPVTCLKCLYMSREKIEKLKSEFEEEGVRD